MSAWLGWRRGWLILSEVPRMPTFAGGAVVLVIIAWYVGREIRVGSRENVQRGGGSALGEPG